ncbi:unnamed protein product [Protopolystoma xenopodis]|uniref:Uncharacterized protein n=1 Tax=Protopolystoma xenopodis TaxID=117903 RepID=A0A3S5BKW5_9PLAT|nr:unnamed protein product [Protopolystoma xenopodis]
MGNRPDHHLRGPRAFGDLSMTGRTNWGPGTNYNGLGPSLPREKEHPSSAAVGSGFGNGMIDCQMGKNIRGSFCAGYGYSAGFGKGRHDWQGPNASKPVGGGEGSFGGGP